VVLEGQVQGGRSKLDVSLSSIAPRVVPDLRPAADAAATARLDRPPAAFGLAADVAPASLVQEGLVTQGFMEVAGPAPVAALDGSSQTSRQAPERVLKPWGIPMLPDEESAEAAEESASEGPGIARDPADADVEPPAQAPDAGAAA